MRGHRWTGRLLGVILLVLAISPVTAPFSACDLAALFGPTAGQGYTAPGQKTSADHSPAAPGEGFDSSVRAAESSRATARTLVVVHLRHDLLLQLRI